MKYVIFSIMDATKMIIPINEREMDSQTQKTDLWLPKGREDGEGRIRSLRLADAKYYLWDG